MKDKKAYAEELNKRFKKASPEEIIAFFLKEFDGRVAVSSSMSAEDQILTHMAVAIDPTVEVFTLDTGRLFPETYDLIQRTNEHYGIKIRVFFPDHREVE